MKKLLYILICCVGIVFSGCDQNSGTKTKALTKTCDQLVSLHTKIQEFEAMMTLNSTDWHYREEKLNEIIAILEPNMAEKKPDCYFMTSKHFPEATRLNFIRTLATGVIDETHGHALNWFTHLRGIFAHDDEAQQFFADELGRIATENQVAYLEYYLTLPDLIDQARLLENTAWPKDQKELERLSEVMYNYEGADGVVIYLRSLAGIKQ